MREATRGGGAKGLAVLSLLALVALASRATAVECGDTVRGAATLDADLDGCGATGLRLVGGAELDCAGHAIRGRGVGEGVVLDRASGAVVRNCRVAGFRTGVRLRGGAGSRVESTEVRDSARYGIELAGQTTRNRIERVLVAGSGDEGIHFGSGADANELVASEIRDSAGENVYLLSVRDCSVVGNLVAGAGSAAIYIKHSSGNLIADNRVHDRIVHMRGASTGNLLSGNTLDGAGFVFEAYRDAGSWTAPSDNQVEGGRVSNAGTCFRFSGAHDNRVRDVAVADCRPLVLKRSGGIAPTGNEVSLTSIGATEVVPLR